MASRPERPYKVEGGTGDFRDVYSPAHSSWVSVRKQAVNRVGLEVTGMAEDGTTATFRMKHGEVWRVR